MSDLIDIVDKVSMNNNASIPANAYISGEDFNKVKNAVNRMSKYPTDEQRIGTWTDGKPLYRATFNIPETDILSNATTVINFTTAGSVLKPKMIYGMIGFQTSNVYYPIIGAADRTSVGYAVRWFNDQALQIIVDKVMYPERKIIGGHLVIEYTKTTD